MNSDKAAFFDTQVEAEWAAAEFTPVESDKVDRVLNIAGLRNGMKVIEPGCGTGRLTKVLAQRVGPTGRVVAFDISLAMTDACMRRVATLQQAEVCCACAEEFPFPRAEFDLVVCHQVFPHFDDKRRAVENLTSALKPTGRFVAFHFIGSEAINDLHRKAHPSVLHDMMPPKQAMKDLFSSVGLEVDYLSDSEDGYVLCAGFTALSGRVNRVR